MFKTIGTIIILVMIYILIFYFKSKLPILEDYDVLFDIGFTYLLYVVASAGERREKEKHDNEKYYAANLIYEYLLNIINKVKNIIIKEQKEFVDINYDDVYFEKLCLLRADVLSDDEIQYLRELLRIVNNYCDHLKGDQSKDSIQLKWVFKKVIDQNLKLDNFNEASLLLKNDQIDFLANVKIISILYKLKMYLDNNRNYNTTKKFDCQTIEISYSKNEISVTKEYLNKKRISSLKDNVGNVEQYETIFTGTNPISTQQEVLYIGEVKDLLFNGKGKYYYYTKVSGKNINSFDLMEHNAKKLTKLLLDNYINPREKKIEGVFVGEFLNGEIKKGIFEVMADGENKKIEF